MTTLDQLAHPVVLAPLSGGPSTPELTAAVSDAGGFGFLAAGYLTVDELATRIARTRALTDKPFGVNLFVPGKPCDPQVYEGYVEQVRADATAAGLPVGEPRFDDDGWEAKLALLEEDPPATVSFTFGCPEPEVIRRMQVAGSEAWVTVTDPDEAAQAKAAGADVLVLQGAEAGGHRGSFANRPDMQVIGLLALLQLTSRIGLPRIAAGGVATAGAVTAVLAAGATAAAAGSAFMKCPEAGTSMVHRAALNSGRPTRLTQSFSGRLARGIVNPFMDRHDHQAVAAYPEIHYLTAPTRAAARERGDGDWVNLWAGQAYPLAQAIPAADVVRSLAGQQPIGD